MQKSSQGDPSAPGGSEDIQPGVDYHIKISKYYNVTVNRHQNSLEKSLEESLLVSVRSVYRY